MDGKEFVEQYRDQGYFIVDDAVELDLLDLLDLKGLGSGERHLPLERVLLLEQAPVTILVNRNEVY